MTKIRFTCLILLLQIFALTAFAQKDYFASIDGVKGGADMKNALYKIIKEHKKISYGSGEDKTWGAFYTTDAVVENGKRRVLDMYSNEERFFGSKGSKIDGMNIEHSVAKSWWGGNENNAYHDLHHLNPSDQTANSRKSNYPLGELTSISWNNGVTFVGKATIDGSSTNAYEPCDEYKGDFARVFMYMFTCYQDLTWKYTWMNYEESTYPTLKPWAVELLLKWHKQDPVSEKEIKRNNAVYEIQGNRNPYVDYPQLADYVWGDSINYTFKLSGGTNTGTDGGEDNNEDIDNTNKWKEYINEDFNGSTMVFTTHETNGNYPWELSSKYDMAVATSYVNNTDNDAESWLISPALDFSKDSIAKLSFEYVIRYSQTNKEAEYHKLLISKDYTGNVSNATWETIDFGATVNSSNWDLTSVNEIILPQEFMGNSNVTIAFYYKGTTTKAGTFEIDNVLLQALEGENKNDNTPDGGDNGNGDEKEDNDNETIPDTNSEMFTLATSVDQLVEGDTIIIVYGNYILGAQKDKYREKVDGAVIENHCISSLPQGAQKIVLEQGTQNNTFAFNVGNGYLAASSNTSNNVQTVEGITDAASWLITINNEYLATIVSQGTYKRNTLQYNTSAPRFSCYQGTQQPVNIYIRKCSNTTAIEKREAKEESFEVYSLTGMHVRSAKDIKAATNGLTKGVYLINGEKVLIK